MHGVVSLVDGLSEQEEIVGVLQKEKCANSAITIGVPNVLFGFNGNVVL